jgi:hypothetical protein
MAFIKIGAGWKTKSGKGYNCVLDGELPEDNRFNIFDNQYKKEDRHPDIILGYFDEDDSDDYRAPSDEPIDDIPF